MMPEDPPFFEINCVNAGTEYPPSEMQRGVAAISMLALQSQHQREKVCTEIQKQALQCPACSQPSHCPICGATFATHKEYLLQGTLSNCQSRVFGEGSAETGQGVSDECKLNAVLPTDASVNIKKSLGWHLMGSEDSKCADNISAYLDNSADNSNQVQNCAMLMIALSYFSYKTKDRWSKIVTCVDFRFSLTMYLSSWAMYSATPTLTQIYGRFVDQKRPYNKMKNCVDRELPELINDLKPFALKIPSKDVLKECRKHAINSIRNINKMVSAKIGEEDESKISCDSFHTDLSQIMQSSINSIIPNVNKGVEFSRRLSRILRQDIRHIQQVNINHIAELNGDFVS